MTKTIYVTLSTFAEYSLEPVELLKQSGLSYQMNTTGRRMTPDEVVQYAGDAEGLVAGVEPYSEETVAKLPSLKCISRVGVGTDSIDHEACKKRGIGILNTPEEPVIAVAELTVGCILSLLRRLPTLTHLTKSRQWKRVPGNLVMGKKVGIIGLGRIGRRVTMLLKCLGAHIIAFDPVKDLQWAKENQVNYVELDQLFKESDIVLIHASAGNNPFMIGQAELLQMKQGAFLVNMARGNMVDDAELAKSLNSGHIAGAAMDVYPQEPYSGPLCDCENVVLTPHEATLTVETRVAMEKKAVANLLNYLKGMR